jgi:hypothetical protein
MREMRGNMPSLPPSRERNANVLWIMVKGAKVWLSLTSKKVKQLLYCDEKRKKKKIKKIPKSEVED